MNFNKCVRLLIQHVDCIVLSVRMVRTFTARCFCRTYSFLRWDNTIIQFQDIATGVAFLIVGNGDN